MTNELAVVSPNFDKAREVAEFYAKSDLIPKAYQGKPANVMLAMEASQRMGVSLMLYMQHSFVLNGKPAISAQLAIAAAAKAGVFEGPITFDFDKDGDGNALRCTAKAKLAKDGTEVTQIVSMDMANKEGWTGRNGSKWKTIPGLMLQYRSATWLIRVYAPECLMGMQTDDELRDVGHVVEPQRLNNSLRTSELTELLGPGESVDAETGELFNNTPDAVEKGQ